MAYTKQNFVDQQVLTAGHLNHIENGIANIWEYIYPVGAIYVSGNATSPAALFGGTWQQLSGRMLIGVGSATDLNGATWTFNLNDAYGSYEHVLTVNEIPSHNHRQVVMNNNGYGGADGQVAGAGYSGDWHYADSYTQTTGGGAGHYNMPPYLAKYMWERVE